jgi:capsule polysaccharide export protein KpsC/LpsZ
VCWGLPFYAGWGLTEDRVATDRRTRSRTLDELVAAALLAYPSYVEPLSGVPCEVEEVLSSILAARAAPTEAARWRLSSPFASLVRVGSRLKAEALQPLVARRRRRARAAAGGERP